LLVSETEDGERVMSDNGTANPTVVRTGRGLTVGGTRLTIYSLIDHFKAGHSDELILEWYPVTREQLADVHRYIDEHRDEVEAEYQEVLRQADENRRYWEERNRERFERIKNTPPTPEQAARRAKLEELRRRRGRS
jgi:uncharacterized protein (DUF433 family)